MQTSIDREMEMERWRKRMKGHEMTFNILLSLEDKDEKSILCPCKNLFHCAGGALPETHFDVTIPLIFCHTRVFQTRAFLKSFSFKHPGRSANYQWVEVSSLHCRFKSPLWMCLVSPARLLLPSSTNNGRYPTRPKSCSHNKRSIKSATHYYCLQSLAFYAPACSARLLLLPTGHKNNYST